MTVTATCPALPASPTIPANLKIKLCLFIFWNLPFAALLLFIPAQTLHFWQAWAFNIVLFISTLGVFIYFYQRDPQALARRTLRREKIGVQRFLIYLVKVLYCSSLILAGLDFRFGWTRKHIGPVPWWVSIAALAVYAGADVWFTAVLNANRFGASVIQVEEGQSVAAGGLYRIIRHPMYLGMTVKWLATPFALGSLVTFPVFCLIIPILAFRILNEETFLKKELPGYAEYCRQVRWRLIPRIW